MFFGEKKSFHIYSIPLFAEVKRLPKQSGIFVLRMVTPFCKRAIQKWFTKFHSGIWELEDVPNFGRLFEIEEDNLKAFLKYDGR